MKQIYVCTNLATKETFYCVKKTELMEVMDMSINTINRVLSDSNYASKLIWQVIVCDKYQSPNKVNLNETVKTKRASNLFKPKSSSIVKGSNGLTYEPLPLDIIAEKPIDIVKPKPIGYPKEKSLGTYKDPWTPKEDDEDPF